MPKKARSHGLKIFQRYHFASALKRMSVIAGHTPPGSVETEYIASVKGAPETLRSMVGLLSALHCCICDLATRDSSSFHCNTGPCEKVSHDSIVGA